MNVEERKIVRNHLKRVTDGVGGIEEIVEGIGVLFPAFSEKVGEQIKWIRSGAEGIKTMLDEIHF